MKSMTQQEQRVIVASLWSARAAVDVALTAFGELADDADGDETHCTHPLEMRQDMTTMGGPEGWRCRSCGFSTLPEDPPPDLPPDLPTEPPLQAEQES